MSAFMETVSGQEEIKEKRAAALLQLRAKQQGSSSAPPSLPANGHTVPAQPLQSRDATVHSRYFPSSSYQSLPSATGTVLVPNSSPLRPSDPMQYNPAFPLQQPQPMPVLSRDWRSNPVLMGDPLSTPTMFSSSATFAPTPSQWSYIAPPNIRYDDSEPPRKRMNLGTPDSMSSPEVRVPGGRIYRGYPMSVVDDSAMFDAPSSGRLTHIRPPTEPESRFASIYEHESRDRAVAAFRAAQGDVNRAQEILAAQRLALAQQFLPPQPPPEKRGAKSAIYRGRANLQQGELESRPKPVRSTRKKGRIVDSDSEPEFDDEDDDDQSDDEEKFLTAEEEQRIEEEAVKFFNESPEEVLVEVTSCTPEQAKIVIELRPFEDSADLSKKLRGKKGVSAKMFEAYKGMLEGYGTVDGVLARCEKVGNDLASAIAHWTNGASPDAVASSDASAEDDAGVHLVSIQSADVAENDSPERRAAMKNYIRQQPSSLVNDIQLKDYQMLGLNWLNLLHSKGLSCILADEMGLGKTVQVIAFFALLKEKGVTGHHLVIVPSSTLENWVREFERFCPQLSVQTYYGSQKDRSEHRVELLGNRSWEVLITTYNLAQGAEPDRKFLRRIEWQTCVFDEGHVLKNFESQRYQHLMRIDAKWRLLLTGTPLQNNLQELVSLMNFILPRYFAEVNDSLRAIFKVKSSSHTSLLSHERVSRAKKMMTPFVLRRRKDQVLKDLPKKTERIEWCEMTPLQKDIYRDTLKRSRKIILTIDEDGSEEQPKKKGKKRARATEASSPAGSSSNILMDLRKAASHPMLFRTLYTEAIVKVMAKQCLKEPEFSDSQYNLVVEDMMVMTDAELFLFCQKYKSVRKHLLKEDAFEDAGKIQTMLRLLDEYKAEGRRVLVFSQFTQILDILQTVLKHRDIKYLVLTGSTPVDERQSLVDEFTEDETIQVFLLSTKAGGMGINLVAASVVIIFDQDFNPHNDLQAADRAYRIGQKRDVDVVKLITRGTIEEDMLKLGATKIALDEAVAGDTEEEVENAGVKAVKASLLSVLRQQFEKEEAVSDAAPTNPGTPSVEAPPTSSEPPETRAGSES